MGGFRLEARRYFYGPGLLKKISSLLTLIPVIDAAGRCGVSPTAIPVAPNDFSCPATFSIVAGGAALGALFPCLSGGVYQTDTSCSPFMATSRRASIFGLNTLPPSLLGLLPRVLAKLPADSPPESARNPEKSRY